MIIKYIMFFRTILPGEADFPEVFKRKDQPQLMLRIVSNKPNLPLRWRGASVPRCGCSVIKYLEAQRAKLMPLVMDTCLGQKAGAGPGFQPTRPTEGCSHRGNPLFSSISATPRKLQAATESFVLPSIYIHDSSG